MEIEEEYIRIIFGLKLKQIRNEKNLSLFGLSKLSKISKSYLNEIEKGKKYPKPDKIAILSNALDVPYDSLVSLKLDKNLAPIGEVLQSKILKEIPLDLFGIQEMDLIDIISSAPAKVNAFISTLIKIGKNYNLTKESFFLAALRSYQEAHNNYFEELETAAEKFAAAYQLSYHKRINIKDLEEILIEEYEYNIVTENISQHSGLHNIRSVYVPKSKTLVISKNIDDSQKAFIYAKEIGYNYLDLQERLYTFTWVKFDSFDQVLHNFMASYFAGALLLPKTPLEEGLKTFFEKKKWKNNHFEKLIFNYTDSPEMFMQRLTNILPKSFHLKNLFFVRFGNIEGTESYSLTKELHITQQQPPTANENHEHYCRRWISLDIFKRLPKESLAIDAQISNYPENQAKYLVLSCATSDPFDDTLFRSVNLGIFINNHAKNKIQFLNDDSVPEKEVGVTCQRCAIDNCAERAAAPTYIKQHQINTEIEASIQEIMDLHS